MILMTSSLLLPHILRAFHSSRRPASQLVMRGHRHKIRSSLLASLRSWGALFASRSTPPLSHRPHHDPGAPLIIRSRLIIRAVTRCQFLRLCRKNRLLGKEGRAGQQYYKGFASAHTEAPSFIFGKVDVSRSSMHCQDGLCLAPHKASKVPQLQLSSYTSPRSKIQ